MTGEWFDHDQSGEQTVRVDSIREAYACVDAYPHASGPWTIISESRSSRDGGRTMTLDLAAPDGDRTTVVFETGHFNGTGGIRRFSVEPTTALDELMSGVGEFVAANPPFHPGSLPRFPVPSRRYPGRVEVPIAILAADDAGRPGLFAPPRVVVVSMKDGKPYGIGEYPGFDPDQWPPQRLGDWPPPATMTLPREQLAARVARFNGVWLRQLEAHVHGATYPQVLVERKEAKALLATLESPGMSPIYGELNTAFWENFDPAGL